MDGTVSQFDAAKIGGDDKTVKKLWQQIPGPVQGELPFGTYHSHPQRYDARLQVIKLYYQGWTKLSISRFLKVSRPTVDLWIRRFEAEHFAGLEDKSRTPHAPPRLVSADGRGLSPPADSRCGPLPHRESAGPRHDFRTHGGTDHGTQQAGVR